MFLFLKINFSLHCTCIILFPNIRAGLELARVPRVPGTHHNSEHHLNHYKLSLDLVRRHSSVDLADKTFAVYSMRIYISSFLSANKAPHLGLLRILINICFSPLTIGWNDFYRNILSLVFSLEYSRKILEAPIIWLKSNFKVL